MLTFPSPKGEIEIVREYGGYWAAICPAHPDRRPSLLIYRSGYCRCLACGWRYRLPHVPALEAPPIYNSSPVELPDFFECHLRLKNSKNGLGELKRRRVVDAIDSCLLGVTGDGWYTIPVRNQYGVPVGVVYRAMPDVQRRTGHRYRVARGQKPMLYAPDSGWYRRFYVFVVFGIFDAISLHVLGEPAITPTSGVGSLQLQWLDDFRWPIIFVPDRGEAGQVMRYLQKMDWRGYLWCPSYPDGSKDVNDYLVNDVEKLRYELETFKSEVIGGVS